MVHVEFSSGKYKWMDRSAIALGYSHVLRLNHDSARSTWNEMSVWLRRMLEQVRLVMLAVVMSTGQW